MEVIRIGDISQFALISTEFAAMRILASITIAISLLLAPALAIAQFKEESTAGPQLGEESVHRLKVGIIVNASAGPCAGVYGTTPVPIDWPEQEVRILEEDISPSVRVGYRMAADTVKEMVINVPQLPAGEVARAIVTFEIRRRILLPPEDTDGFQVPKRPDRALRQYLGASPYIEIRDGRVRRAAREAVEGKEGTWEIVEAIYDYAREKVEYTDGPLKGAAEALKDGSGDCEELSSLFIAMCRINKIPARTVWVDGHCYPEFYLEDEEEQGHWIPCQAAGTRSFGGISEVRPILQKGDNFRLPGRSKPMRYVSEFLQGKKARGAAKPEVKFIRQLEAGVG